MNVLRGEKISHKAYCNYSYDYDYDSVIENYLDKKVIKIYHRDYDSMLVVVFEDEREDLK